MYKRSIYEFYMYLYTYKTSLLDTFSHKRDLCAQRQPQRWISWNITSTRDQYVGLFAAKETCARNISAGTAARISTRDCTTQIMSKRDQCIGLFAAKETCARNISAGTVARILTCDRMTHYLYTNRNCVSQTYARLRYARLGKEPLSTHFSAKDTCVRNITALNFDA